MPDRRQGDRRESSSILNKKISISLGNFILLIIIAVLLIASVVSCRLLYVKGYNEGYSDACSESLLDSSYSDEYEDIIDISASE